MSKRIEDLTAGEIMLRVRCASHQIAAARKQAVSQYDAELRKLSDLDMLLSTPEGISQPELFKVATVLTPELIRRLETPLIDFV